MSVLRRLAAHLGAPGILAGGVLMLCAGFYWGVVKPAEQAVQAQRAAAAKLASRIPHQPVSADRRIEDLQRFHHLFPPLERLPAEVEKLWALAVEHKLELQTGEYRLDGDVPGLRRYRMNLPVRGTYTQLRLFVDAILKTLPTLSIDGLRFERKRVSDTELEAQLALTLYFRPVAATATVAATPRP